MARVNPFSPVKPPFTDAMPLIAPNGELWVERSVSATVPPLWDVFDATGQLVRRYQAPNGRRLVALGRGTVYAVVQDADGLERVESGGQSRHSVIPSGARDLKAGMLEISTTRTLRFLGLRPRNDILSASTASTASTAGLAE